MNLDELKKNLESKNYTCNIFDKSEDAIKYLSDKISNTSVGFGGSITLEQIGLYDALKQNNEVHWHWNGADKVERDLARTSKVYISSVNGISMDGQIVNIDGTGNRVSSIQYGHDLVVFVLGINKIEENVDKAIERAKNIAAPLNAKRLNKNTPCVIDNMCQDCKSPDRICCGLSLLYKAPKGAKYEVVIINENLGY